MSAVSSLKGHLINTMYIPALMRKVFTLIVNSMHLVMVPVITVPLGALNLIVWSVYCANLKREMGKKRVVFEDSNKLTYSVAAWKTNEWGCSVSLPCEERSLLSCFDDSLHPIFKNISPSPSLGRYESQAGS